MSLTPSTKGLELAAAAGVTEFAEGLGFYLADALAGDLEGLTDLFEGVRCLFEAEAHLDRWEMARTALQPHPYPLLQNQLDQVVHRVSRIELHLRKA
jgi:hypothetical protein